LWATSESGVWRSLDAGAHWSPEDLGLTEPGTSWALTASRGRIFSSDAWHVYRWHTSHWVAVSNQSAVVMFDPLPLHSIAASSMGQGIRVLTNRRWTASDA